eukprot:764624-Amphidinium_carterae.1
MTPLHEVTAAHAELMRKEDTSRVACASMCIFGKLKLYEGGMKHYTRALHHSPLTAKLSPKSASLLQPWVVKLPCLLCYCADLYGSGTASESLVVSA